MNLLLILSALLSALTGAAAAGRMPEVRLHQAVASVTLPSVAASTAEGRVVRHPVAVALKPILTAIPAPDRTIDVSAIIPLYMARRRE